MKLNIILNVCKQGSSVSNFSQRFKGRGGICLHWLHILFKKIFLCYSSEFLFAHCVLNKYRLIEEEEMTTISRKGKWWLANNICCTNALTWIYIFYLVEKFALPVGTAVLYLSNAIHPCRISESLNLTAFSTESIFNPHLRSELHSFLQKHLISTYLATRISLQKKKENNNTMKSKNFLHLKSRLNIEIISCFLLLYYAKLQTKNLWFLLQNDSVFVYRI